MSPRRGLAISWPIVVTTTLLGVVVAWVLLTGVASRYDASAEVLLEPSPGGAIELDGRTVGSYAVVLGGPELTRAAAEALSRPPLSADDVRAEVVDGTGVLRVTVRADSLADAEEVSGRLATDFVSWLQERQGDIPTERRVRAEVLDPGTGSTQAVEPDRLPGLVAGALLGLLVGLVVSRWRQNADHGVTSAEDLEETTGVAVLGSIAHDRDVREAPLMTSLSSHHPRAEAVRILRTNLQFVDLDRSRKVVTVTSSVEDEGKTTTAANLAISLAQSGLEVALVEGDLRRPRVAELFGLEGGVGLTTVLVGRVPLERAVQPTEVPGLDVLGSGAQPPNPAEIVQTDAMADLVEALRERYDVVLIDAPPLLPVTDAALLAELSDGALLVVRHGRTGHAQVRAAVGRLENVGARLLGTVISMSPRRAAARYGYGYEYAPERRAGGRRAR